jgi:hypothetical protein
MLIPELFSGPQKIDLDCWQIMPPALFGVLDQETVWDLANRVVDGYLHSERIE